MTNSMTNPITSITTTIEAGQITIVITSDTHSITLTPNIGTGVHAATDVIEYFGLIGLELLMGGEPDIDITVREFETVNGY